MPLRSIFQKNSPSTPKRHKRTASSPLVELGPADNEVKTPMRSRSKTLLSSPRTPLTKIFTSFGGMGGESWGRRIANKNERDETEEDALRPSSASSSYSSSSEDSFISMRTMGTSYTLPEDTSVEGHSLLPAAKIYSKEDILDFNQLRMVMRMRDTEWTKETDGHLWTTYLKYQQDPTVTPFYIQPGGVPPLGVCLRVARTAKLTWREIHEKRNMTPSSRSRRARTPISMTGDDGAEIKVGGLNKGNLIRRSVLASWPFSESSTRKRLRLLCRRQYGSSRNPYHDHANDYKPRSDQRIRNRFRTPEPIPEGLLFSGPPPPEPSLDDSVLSEIYHDDQARFEHDALLSSRRSMQLSLTTSIAMSMEPDGVISSSSNSSSRKTVDLDDPDATEDELEIGDQMGPELGRYPLLSGATERQRNSIGGILNTVTSDNTIAQRGEAPINFSVNTRENSSLSSKIEPPVLLSPLKLGFGSSPYGTWPRRQKPSEDHQKDNEQETSGSQSHIKRVLGHLFSAPSNSLINASAPAQPKIPQSRSRLRGVTVSDGSTNNLGWRRRFRASPALALPQQLPSWAYESSQDIPDKPNLAQLLGAQPLNSGLTARLGSPFVPDSIGKGKTRIESSEDVDGVQRPSTASASMVSAGVQVNLVSDDGEESRPVKRVRE